jgi:DNA-binding transcriptional LysR family regulator
MNPRFVETFLTLARLGSFRATAAAMHATPAAISLRIKTLEAELGVELIEREAAEFQLTANGEWRMANGEWRMAARACPLRGAGDAFAATGRAGRTQVTKRLRLGVIETVVHS